MRKKPLSYTEKLTKLEKEKESLLNRRKDELFNIFTAHSSITIDDKLLIGFLLFATNSDNKDHAILKQFKELALAKTPRKFPQQN
jgi:hypothetical protein